MRIRLGSPSALSAELLDACPMLLLNQFVLVSPGGCLVGKINTSRARREMGKYLRRVSGAKLHEESFWNSSFTWKDHI